MDSINSARNPLKNTKTCFSMKKKKNAETQTHYISAVPKRVLSVCLVCASKSPMFAFSAFFFFFNQRLLHCSWDMNSAIKHMNSNQISNNNFFIIFSFQQNKRYPNTHIGSVWIQLILLKTENTIAK